MPLRDRYARPLRSTRPRHRYRPSLERLEIREVLSTFTWTGKGDGTSFNQASNWNPVGLPNSLNDVVINAGAVTITMPSTAITVHSLTQTSGTLKDNGGSIMAIVGYVTLINVNLDLTGGDGPANFVVEGGASTLSGTILPSTTLRVEGGVVSNGSGTDAVLTLQQGSVNTGSITLKSLAGSASGSDLAVATGQTFVNQGTITASASTTATLTGGFTNDGTFTIGASATVVVDPGSASAIKFLQQAGTLDTSAGGQFLVEGGTLEVAGGSVVEPSSSSGLAAVGTGVVGDGGSLELDKSITAATTIYAAGTTTLLGNDSAMGTVWVEGGLLGQGASATLTLDPDANNAGSLVVQSLTSSGASSNLSVPSGLTYDEKGSVTVSVVVTNPASAVASTLTGHFTNDGVFTIGNQAAMFAISGALTTPKFVQQSGTLDVSSGGELVVQAGTLEVAGGTIVEPSSSSGLAAVGTGVVAYGCSLQMDKSITAATTVYATGTTTLLGNDSAMGTVWVEGGLFKDVSMKDIPASLMLDSDANNSGHVVLETLTGSKAGSDLVVPSGPSFVDRGTVTVVASQTASTLVGPFTNAGAFTVAAGATIVVNSGSNTYGFVQQAGTLDASQGQLLCEGATLEVAGGTIVEPSSSSGLATPGTGVVADNCQLQMDKSITTPTTVYVGGTTELLSNDSPQATVWIEAGLVDSGSELTLASTAQNLGTIVLQSMSGSNATSNIDNDTGAVFVNAGTIAVNPSNTASTIGGDYTNTGTLNLNNALLTLSDDGAVLTNAPTGKINASGVLDVTTGSFTNAGVLNVGTPSVTGKLSIAGSFTQASTGILNLKIGGLTPISQFDLFHVSAQATLGGTLNIVSPLLNGFAPAATDVFQVLTFESVVNQFATYTFPTLSGNLAFSPTQTATSLTLTVNPADLLAVATPGNVLAGVGFGLTVAVQTPSGTTDSNYDGVVAIVLASPAGGTLGGTLTATAVNGVASFSGLTLDVAGSGYSIEATAPGQVSATTNPFTVTADAATQLVISSLPPSTVTAGAGFGLGVTVEDAFGNTITDDFGTLTIAVTSGPAGSLVGGQVSVSAAGGHLAFTGLTLNKVSTGDTLSITQSGLAGATTGPIAVTPAPPSQLVITQQTTAATAGTGFAIAVAIDDAFGNLETADAATLTATLASGAGPLLGTTTVAASGGVATFSNLIDDAAGPILIQFSGSGLAGEISSQIVVSPAAATALVVQTQPSATAKLGQPFAVQPVIDEVDPFGNVETGDSSTTINVALASGSGPLLGSTSVTISAGVAKFSNLADGKVETLSLVFGGGGLANVTSNSIVIARATPTITWPTPAPIVYGTALGTAQLDASASFNGAALAGTFVYAPTAGTILHAGQVTLSATFTPTDSVDYAPVATSVMLTVLQAPVITTWPSPAAITYDMALGSSQLDATASVPGTFVYAPAAGTILHAGKGQSLSATFTPTDAIDYAPVTINVTINVLQAAPLITWAYPAAIVYGTPLGSSQLDATASVPGTFAYAPASGTILKVGAGQALLVTFTPTDAIDYSIGNSSATINVLAVMTTTSLAIAPGAATFGQSVTLSATVSGTPGAAAPTGSVTFLDGSTVLGSATLDGNGHASFSTARLPLGTRSITASYSGDAGDATSVSSAIPLYVGDVPKVDFTGDGKVDLSVFGIDPNTGRYDYRIIDSSTGKTIVYDNNGYGYGNSRSIPIVGDFFGDGRASYALWTPNAFGGMTFTAVSPLNYKSISINFGSTTDLPVVADVDGDGKEDFGVYGFQAGLNYRFDFVLSSYNFSVNFQDIFNNNGYGYGNAQSIPLVADFDGSGKAGFGLFNPSANGSNFAYVNPATGASIARTIGAATDTPTAVDFDGDGKADLALYGPDPSVHGHYRYLILDSSSGFSVSQAVKFDNNGYGYGNSTSIPVMADYEGNGKADFGLFTADGKGGNEFVYLLGQTGTGVFVDFATATDIPLTAPTYLVAKKVRGS